MKNFDPKKFDPQKESSDSLYLQQLKYNEKAGKTWLSFFIRNFRVTVLIVIGILAWGITSFTLLPLESQPEVTIPFGVVSVALPGASPEDVEELVVEKIESRVVNLSGVKQVQSSALNSFASVSVEFRAEEDLKDAIRRLRDAVEGVKGELPEEASDPIVSEVSFDDSPVWTVVVTGPYDNFALRSYAEIVQKELEKLPGANAVRISGGDLYEIRVTYDPQQLERYGLSMDQVNGIIRSSNFSLPLGTIDISDYEYIVRTEGEFTNARELRKLPIPISGGDTIQLEDVAVVVERARERSVSSRFSIEGEEPHNAVTLNIVKKTGSSITDLIDAGKEKIEELKKSRLPKDLNVETTLDFAEEIRKDFDQLVHDGLLTILLVTIILFLFVGLKEAFVAGLAVPLAFSCAFGLMYLFGISLNFLSIFSLILSLGLLVDDAIVVVQATKQYLQTGKFTPEEAVLLVFQDYKVLLTTTTLTTIWAFVPLLLATGIIGQFIRSIPVTVSVTIAASYFIAIIINHPMAIILERFRLTRTMLRIVLAVAFIPAIFSVIGLFSGNISALIPAVIFGSIFIGLLMWYRTKLRIKLQHNEDLIQEELADPEKIKAKIRHHYKPESGKQPLFIRLITGVIKLEKFLPAYGRFLASILKSRGKSWLLLLLVGGLFVASAALPATGILKSEFLPPADAEYMYINIEGSPGLISERTRAVADQVEEVLLNEKAIESFSVVIGSGGVNISEGSFTDTAGGGQGNRAQFAINLYPIKVRPPTGPENRVEKSYDIGPRIRKAVENIEGAKIDVVELAGGPPSGADIEGQITGENMQVLEHEANKYKDLLSAIPGTVNEKTSLSLSPGEFTFKLDHDSLALHAISAPQIASTLRAALSGTEVTKILRDGEEIIVRAEFDKNKIPTIDALENVKLVNNRGQLFRLGDVADIELGSSVTSIGRIDQKRVLVLSAAVEKPYLPAEVLLQFQEIIQKNPLPEGYEITFGGQNETNNESVFSILRAMLVAMILIVGTLVIQFNSFRKAVLVLATIPLALIGVFFGLTLINFTLSFPGLIGILALFGIVVKNAVMLVDKINLNLRVGIPYVESIVDASQSRLEAIFLTSICTMIGMLPITLGNETWEGLGASLIFGLASSTFMTLFVIPVLFKILMEKKTRKDARLLELKAKISHPGQNRGLAPAPSGGGDLYAL